MPTPTPDAATDSRYVDYIPLDEIQLAPRNPKGHADALIHRMITHHGLVELPALDERTGRLVAGHGRHKQLTEMHAQGKQPPGGVQVGDNGRWRMPVLRGWSSASDDDAEAYLIGSNRSTELGGWDDDRMLAEILGDLSDVQLLELAGYDTDSLERLLHDSGALGDAAAGMFRPSGTGDVNDDEDSPEGEQAGRDASPYVVVQWTVTPAEREVIRAAVRIAQERWQKNTAAEALVALMTDYTEKAGALS
jgi:hypothetical protein